MKLAMIFEPSDKMPMSPKEFCDEMKRLAKDDYTETWHINADDLMCSLLRTLGYEDGVEIFESKPKWYS